MPTAANLVAAILFAGLAWTASELAERRFPEGTDMGWFAEANAALGAVVGWRLAGGRSGGWTGATPAGAVGHGLTAAVATAVAALVLHGFVAMVPRSLRRLYDGPTDALVGVVEIALRDGRVAASPAVVATLLGGGAAAGLLTAWVGRRLT